MAGKRNGAKIDKLADTIERSTRSHWRIIGITSVTALGAVKRWSRSTWQQEY
jgi:hypothetical protein